MLSLKTQKSAFSHKICGRPKIGTRYFKGQHLSIKITARHIVINFWLGIGGMLKLLRVEIVSL